MKDKQIYIFGKKVNFNSNFELFDCKKTFADECDKISIYFNE